MDLLSRLYSRSICTLSPCVVDYERKVSYVDGNEVITFEKVDNRKRVIANGTVAYWSLANLIKAGINPNTGIHTTSPTRLDGLGELNLFGAVADKILSSEPAEPAEPFEPAEPVEPAE